MLTKIYHFILYQIATGFGSGHSPIASGTAGSLVAVVLVYFFWPVSVLAQFAIVIGTTAIGIYSAGWLAEAEGLKDPSIVVIDEIAGQFTTFLFLAPFVHDWKILLAGFILFRIFDIWKPWPISKLEDLPGGFGIVLDDSLGGVFACIVLHLGIRFIY